MTAGPGLIMGCHGGKATRDGPAITARRHGKKLTEKGFMKYAGSPAFSWNPDALKASRLVAGALIGIVLAGISHLPFVEIHLIKRRAILIGFPDQGDGIAGPGVRW